MQTHSRNQFDDNYPIRNNDFLIIEAEVDKLNDRIKGLTTQLVEVKANMNNLNATVDHAIHGESNKEIIDILNGLRDMRTAMLEIEAQARKARKLSRSAQSREVRKHNGNV